MNNENFSRQLSKVKVTVNNNLNSISLIKFEGHFSGPNLYNCLSLLFQQSQQLLSDCICSALHGIIINQIQISTNNCSLYFEKRSFILANMESTNFILKYCA